MEEGEGEKRDRGKDGFMYAHIYITLYTLYIFLRVHYVRDWVYVHVNVDRCKLLSSAQYIKYDRGSTKKDFLD